MNVVKLKKGRYLIGDPCYIFSNRHLSEWHNFLDRNHILKYGDTRATGYEQEACIFSTAYGDGVYSDNEQLEYTVDSGLIGAVHYTEGHQVPENMHVYRFDVPVECFNDDGILHFGSVVINTKENGDE